MRWLALALLSIVALVAAAPSAVAQTTIAPPGQSAIDQYLEVVPSDRGNTPAPGSIGGTPAAGRRAVDVLPAAARRALRRQGADGLATAALAAGTAPAQLGGTPAAAAAAAAAARGSADGDPSGLLSTLTTAVTGTDGGDSGILLPSVLLAVVLGGIAFVVVRRRGDRDSAAA